MASTTKLQLQEAVKDAMRARDKQKLGALRLIMSEIKRKEVDDRCEVDDAAVLTILTIYLPCIDPALSLSLPGAAHPNPSSP